MNRLSNPLILEIIKYLDLKTLILLNKIKLINNFDNNQKKTFYKIIWKQVKINLNHYQNIYKPWKYNNACNKFIYYFAAYNKIVPVYIKPCEWIKLFLLK